MAAAHAETPPIFSYLNNAIGFADRQGCCAMWMHFDQTIEVDNHAELPVRFQLNSKPRYFENSCLGNGWWFPLLESTVVQADENSVNMFGPGGFVYRMFRDAQEENNFVSPDSYYKGSQNGDRFDVEGKDGWSLHYKEGRLHSMNTPEGDTLTWEYKGQRVISIKSSKKGTLLEARYDPANSLLSGVTLGGRKTSMTFDYGKRPLVQQTAIGNTISAIVPTLAGVKNSDGFEGVFSIQPNAALDELSLTSTYTSEDKKEHQEHYIWDAKSLLLKSDQTGTYAITGAITETGTGRTEIARTLTTGDRDRYLYDSTTGIWEHALPDGTSELTQYIMTPGPAFGKPRQISRRLPDGRTELFEQNYYSATGLLQRRLTKNEEFRYDAAGKLLAVLKNGKIVYDFSGKKQ